MGTFKVEPTNELSTREWFAAHIDEFDYDIVASQLAFPDYVLRDKAGQMRLAEVEYQSQNFYAHKHDADECHMVICWHHTLNLPLPVLELSTKILHKPNEGASGNWYKEDTTRQEFNEAVEQCPEALDAFLVAMVHDLRAYGQWMDLIGEPRLALGRAVIELFGVLKKETGFDAYGRIGEIHPWDVFDLLYKRNKIMPDLNDEPEHEPSTQ